MDSANMSTYQDCSSKDTVKQIVSIDNFKAKNFTALEKVRSKMNTYKRSYDNKQRKSLSPCNSETALKDCEETNLTNSFLNNLSKPPCKKSIMTHASPFKMIEEESAQANKLVPDTNELSDESQVNATQAKLNRLQPRFSFEINPDESFIFNSAKNLFVELSNAESNSDSSNAAKLESSLQKNKKECNKTMSSDKQISINTSIGKKTIFIFICVYYINFLTLYLAIFAFNFLQDQTQIHQML